MMEARCVVFCAVALVALSCGGDDRSGDARGFSPEAGTTGGATGAGGTPIDPDCYPGTLTIESTADIAALSSYGCVAGDLVIHDTDFVTLGELSKITTVHGGLTIEGNRFLTSLEGLNNITSLAGTIFVTSNDALLTLDGLSAVASAGGLLIAGNAVLTSLVGLRGLRLVGNVFVAGNQALVSLEGLEGISSIGGFMLIGNNDSLSSLRGLDQLASVGKALTIVNHAALASLAGMGQLRSIGGRLWVENNSRLPQCECCRLLAQLGPSSREALFSKNQLDTCRATCD